MNYIAHHGILGQKWGVRRFQNEDGSLTNAGKSRYDKNSDEYKQRKAESKAKVRAQRTQKFKRDLISASIALPLSVAASTAYRAIAADKISDPKIRNLGRFATSALSSNLGVYLGRKLDDKYKLSEKSWTGKRNR